MKHITKNDRITLAVNHYNMYGVNVNLDDFLPCEWTDFCTKLYSNHSVPDANRMMNSISANNLILFNTEGEAQAFLNLITECIGDNELQVISPEPIVDFVWSQIIGERHAATV